MESKEFFIPQEITSLHAGAMLLCPGGKFPGKTIPVQGHACFTERSTIHPRAFVSPKWNREVKSYQAADTSLLAAGSQHQQSLSQLCPRRNCPSITTDSLEQIALVPPEEWLCLTSISLVLCVPGRNRLHKEGQSCRHTTVTPCLHRRAGHRLSPQGIWGVLTAG